MAPADDLAVDHQGRPDGDPSLAEAYLHIGAESPEAAERLWGAVDAAVVDGDSAGPAVVGAEDGSDEIPVMGSEVEPPGGSPLRRLAPTR